MRPDLIKRTADPIGSAAIEAAMVDPGFGVLGAGQTYGSVTDKIAGLVQHKEIGKYWAAGISLAGTFVMILTIAACYLFLKGVGIWGINMPVAWGFAIINFVWWVGIGHAGTFISAMLLLMRQDWRTSINRFAEAMTLFAVACAGMFPLLHMGRPWYFYWLLPYPNTMLLWPQFRSPLVWDAFAVSTYASISAVFWFIGLIPDLASLRDRSENPVMRVVWGMAALGWRNSARHWHRYQTAYLLLGALAAPLVISVHSVVSMDFAGGVIPGWHATIFPPYFVAGAIYSGFAMVLTLMIPMRTMFHLEGMITLRHLENCAKLILVTGLIVGYGYAFEAFTAWYSGSIFEQHMMWNRMTGAYAPCYWTLIFCNVVTPNVLWFRWVRVTPVTLFFVSLVIQTGMWLERFVIIITSLHQEFIPSKWGMYYPTIWDWAVFTGTIGFFFFAFLVFLRILPVISIFEMRELVHQTDHMAAERAEREAAIRNATGPLSSPA
jgi:Ni/Fe-hydrogenase subunit HybB-like protein